MIFCFNYLDLQKSLLFWLLSLTPTYNGSQLWLSCRHPLDFLHRNIFGFSLPPVVCRRAHVFLKLFVLFVYNAVSITYCVVVLLAIVLCTLCCQFLWIINLLLPLRYSLTFIYSFSGLTFSWLPLRYSPTFICSKGLSTFVFLVFLL